MARNIALLTVDALRADHLSYQGYHRNTSPNIDAIASDSLTFRNAYATSSHTRESVPSILTGHHPTDAIDSDFSLAKPTIASLLDDKFATGAFHSNPYVSRAFGFDDGFDHFDDDMYLGRNKYLALLQRGLDKFILNRGSYHARAEEINQRSLDWIDTLAEQQPFFLWNHYMDPHGPYNPPDGSPYTDVEVSDNEAQELYHRLNEEGNVAKSDHQLAIDLYDGEIRYLDNCLENFIRSLETRGLLTETLIMISADHGDLFGEYDQYGHPRIVVPELNHVPLILSSQGSISCDVDTPISTIDIVPTILETFGRESQNLPGVSLFEKNEFQDDRVVFSSATGQEEAASYRRFAGWGKKWGFTMKRAIPSGEVCEETSITLRTGEEVEIHSTDQEESKKLIKLREAVRAWSESRVGDHDENKEIPEHDEVEKRLEALGYK